MEGDEDSSALELAMIAGGGKHAVGVIDDGAGARGWADERAGGAGGGVGGHVQGAGSGKHAVGVCDDGAGARGWADEAQKLIEMKEMKGRAQQLKKLQTAGWKVDVVVL
jgi:hypothetical protein